jgi:hypothetical protein
MIISNEEIYAKIDPFLQELKERGLLAEFNVSEWIIPGTKAFKFAQVNLSGAEREILHDMFSLFLR